MQNLATYTRGIATPSSLIASALACMLGLVFGSFLNVCITRLPRGESVSHPPSHCRSCRRPLAWFENFPVVSWLALRGRCRTCGVAIPWRYPLVEIALACLWLECYRRFGTSPKGFCAALLCFLLLALAFTDWETMLLPDALTLPGLAAGVVIAFRADTLTTPRNAAAGAALGAALLLVISGI